MPRHAELQRRSWPILLGICAKIIAVWIAFAIFSASNFVYNALAFADPAEWTSTLLFQLSSAAMWAPFTPVIAAFVERLSFRRGRIVRSVLILLAAIPLIAVTRAVAGSIALDLGEGRLPSMEMIRTSFTIRIHLNIFIVTVIAGLTRMMDAYRDAEEEERRAVALQTAVVDAEAERLRAQTQPSFLFGTLRAIRDRVRTAPEVADHMLVTLGELLRRRLHQPAARTVTLEEELELAERYVELQQIRLNVNTSMLLDVEEDVLSATVPAFALQTLLETAIGDDAPTSIIVRGHARGDVLALEAHATPVELTFDATSAAEARLRQWFGAEHTAGVRRDGNTMIALVELQLRFATDGAR